MEESNNAILMLDFIDQPAFYVRNGVVLRANPSADRRQILPGMPVTDLINAEAFQGEYLPAQTQACKVTVNGISSDATVTPLNGDHLVLMESDNAQAQLQSLALAAQHFRSPLSGAMALTDMLMKNTAIREDDTALSQATQLSRGLSQIQRMVCDMSDTWQYSNLNSVRKVSVEIGSVFNEILEKAHTILEAAGIKLDFTGLPQPLYCVADPQMLERAIYNLISNSVKFSSSNSQIDAKLSQNGDMLVFSIWNHTEKGRQGNIFSRFLREPGVEENIFGIGLGMMLIRSVAAAHGGTVLMDHTEETGSRITMTLKIDTDNRENVSGPVLGIVDYAGGRDHALLELSDILPSHLYDPMKY